MQKKEVIVKLQAKMEGWVGPQLSLVSSELIHDGNVMKVLPFEKECLHSKRMFLFTLNVFDTMSCSITIIVIIIVVKGYYFFTIVTIIIVIIYQKINAPLFLICCSFCLNWSSFELKEQYYSRLFVAQ